MSCYATRGWGDGPAIQEPAPFAKGRVAAKPIRHKNVRAMFNGTQRFPTNSISNSQQADHPSLTAMTPVVFPAWAAAVQQHQPRSPV